MIISDQFLAIAYHWNEIIPAEKHKFFSAACMKKNILENHGPLCALYKAHDDGRFSATSVGCLADSNVLQCSTIVPKSILRAQVNIRSKE